MIEVGAGETFEYRIRLDVKHPGTFESAMELFLQENPIRAVTLRVSGTADEASRGPKP